ncbi:hypothetical protein QAD02_018416 [Eretmocerus hayati]|uniref:Uncharacterized protein n=1 Tax=Eretmocerus hayati TaxID=131215 RepID=A0ACC2PJ48_9HYME|nr:hypothetical protein QAD02_018416 [Eretmocerus hayati]
MQQDASHELMSDKGIRVQAYGLMSGSLNKVRAQYAVVNKVMYSVSTPVEVVDICSKSYNGRSTGITDVCVFNQVPEYHVGESYSVGVMHNFGEDVCDYRIENILHGIILDDKILDVKTLNQRLKEFDFDPHETNRPRKETPLRLDRSSLLPPRSSIWPLLLVVMMTSGIVFLSASTWLALCLVLRHDEESDVGTNGLGVDPYQGPLHFCFCCNLLSELEKLEPSANASILEMPQYTAYCSFLEEIEQEIKLPSYSIGEAVARMHHSKKYFSAILTHPSQEEVFLKRSPVSAKLAAQCRLQHPEILEKTVRATPIRSRHATPNSATENGVFVHHKAKPLGYSQKTHE